MKNDKTHNGFNRSVVFFWLVSMLIHMTIYIVKGMEDYAQYGYEGDWDFRLLAFAISRAPYWIVGLVFFLTARRLLLRYKSGS